MKGYRTGFVLLGFIVVQVQVADCINCLNCKNIRDLSNCRDVKSCKANEVCYIEKTLSGETFQTLYNTGCKSVQYCVLEFCNKQAYGDGNSRRKRQSRPGEDLTLCSECCYEDSCNTKGCGYIHHPNNVSQCYSCNEVYDGGPPCTTTEKCDLKLFACSTTLSDHSDHWRAYDLGCKYKRVVCDLFHELNKDQVDENVKCCDTPLCNSNPYYKKVNKTALAMNFMCPTGIVGPTTTTTTTTAPTSTSTLPTTPAATSKTTITTTFRPTTSTTTTAAATTTTAAAPTSTSTLPTTPAATSKTTITTTSRSYEDACSFDHTNLLCSWKQSSTDSFDWTIQSGPTQTSDTGPTVDHSLGNAQGKYLFIESSAPRKEGDYAQLESPVLPSSKKICLSLWYYMYGNGMGNLTILVQKAPNRVQENVFNLSGDQGQRWCPALVEVPASATLYDYRLIIQATVGATYRGDIAIDDVHISETVCTVTKCSKASGVAIVG